MSGNEWKSLPIIKELFQIKAGQPIPEGAALLLEAMVIRVFEDGQDIVVFGEPPDEGMYILLDGQAEVLLEDGAAVGALSAGDVIGELGLIKDDVRRATVRTRKQAVCANISRPLFQKIAAENQKVYGALLDILYTKNTSMVRESERLKSELEIASKIQTGLLPKDFSSFGRDGGLHITAEMKPAKEVGGDFYDLFFADKTKLCFLIADVSGKGVPAALFMTMAKIHLKNYISLGMPLEEAVFRANNQLCANNEEELFVTAFVGVLDTEENKVRFVNAGHNKPFLSSGGKPFEMIRCRADFILGMMEDMPYQEQELDFAAGDRLYLYTDGVTEALNPEEELFSDERLETLLNECLARQLEPESLIARIYQELAEFADNTPQSDDITMVYLVR